MFFFDLGMYVETNYDEINEIFYYIRRNTDAYNQDYRKHRIYTTLKCNAKCHYCFQKMQTGGSMSTSIADKIVDRIIEKQGKANNLVITWFGGEPLINTQIIDYISQRLKNELPQVVNYSSFMITNGSLIDDIVIKKAVDDWNLEAVQITLDGLKESYERIKNFGIEDAFNKVVENIHKLLDAGIKVRIRINYDENNIDEVLELIEYLSKEFVNKSLLFVYAHRIFSDECKDNSKLATEKYDIIIWNRLYENGFIDDILESIKPRMISCTAGSLYNEMYLPNGDLGKCAQAISDGDIIGNVDFGAVNALVSRWGCGLLESKCIECILLPVCGGGCMYEKFKQKNGCFISEEVIKHKLLCYLKKLVDG